MLKTYSFRSKTIDFFERIGEFEIKKPQLMKTLILVELLGIAILVWYLREPLYQKYLTVSNKTYSISSLNQSQKYIFTKGDFLAGTAAAGNKIIILLRQENDLSKRLKTKMVAGADGGWHYRFPADLKEGKYRMTVGVFGNNNQVVSIDTYRIRALSNNILVNNRDLKSFFAGFSNTNVSNSLDLINSKALPESLPEPAEIEEISQAVVDLNLPLTIPQPLEQTTTPDKPVLDN